MKIKFFLIGAIALLAFTSCESRNEDVVEKAIEKNSIVMELSTSHYKDSIDVVKVYYKVYDNNGRLVRSIEKLDTVPYLGKTKQTAYDKEDNQIEVYVPTEYEFFVTVK